MKFGTRYGPARLYVPVLQNQASPIPTFSPAMRGGTPSNWASSPPGEGSKRTSAFLHPSAHPQPRWWPASCSSCGAAVPLWLQLPLWEVAGGGRGHLKGPCWQQHPVKPASCPRPPARSSPEAWIPPVFCPVSMFGHSCSFQTVPLSLLQVVAGRSQRAPKRLAHAEPDSGLQRLALGHTELPVDVTPLSEPPSSGHASREGFVRTMKRRREGAPCPQLTPEAPLPPQVQSEEGINMGGLNPQVPSTPAGLGACQK